jgi:DNA-directed RNA polymerase alpha subunit
MKKYTPDSNLKELLENYDISVRAFNVCEEIGLKSIRDVHNYFSKRNDFLEIRNCGIKTKKELHELNQTFFSEFQVVQQQSLFEKSNLETNSNRI